MAINNFIGDLSSAALSEWNTATNWSLGHVPLSTEDLTFTGIPADPPPAFPMTITTTAASAKSVDFSTAGAAFTLSGAARLTVSGNTNITNATITLTERIVIAADGTFTTAGADLSSLVEFRVNGGADVTLNGTINLGSKQFSIYNAGTVLITANNTINCGIFTDGGNSGAITLTLGTSAINCTLVSFGAATVTKATATETVNISHAAHVHDNFGGAAWGTVNYHMTPTANDVIYNIDGNAATFVNFHAHLLAAKTGTTIQFAQNNTFTAMDGNGNSATNTLAITTSLAGTHRTFTDTAGINVFTNCVIQEIDVTGGALWQALLTGGNTVTDSTGWQTSLINPKNPRGLLMGVY